MKFCFYGDLSQSFYDEPKGGGDHQIALLVKNLIVNGHEVVIVDTKPLYKTSDSPIKMFGSNDIYDSKRQFSKIKKIFICSHFLSEINADIYMCTVRGWDQIIPLLAAKKIKKTYIYWTASDLDSLGFCQRWKYHYSKSFSITIGSLFKIILIEVLFHIVINRADYVLVQHQFQKDNLARKKIKSYIFNNLVIIPELIIPDSGSDAFLYIGALDIRKGFDVLFNIIRDNPDLKFVLIGKPRGANSLNLFNDLNKRQNVRLLGYVDNCTKMSEIRKAKALISTSPMEGFPIVFLEAWACGVPVVSLKVDPGNVIKNHNLGYCANGNVNVFISYLETVIYNFDSQKLWNYVKCNHSSDQASVRLIEILAKLTD